MRTFKTLDEIVKEVAPTLQCNCDLDRWEPERDTWHSHVCRIHKESKRRYALEAMEADKYLHNVMI